MELSHSYKLQNIPLSQSYFIWTSHLLLRCFQSSPITRCNKYPYVCDLQGLAHVSGKFPEMELVAQREHPLKVCIRRCKNILYRPCTNLHLYSQFQHLSPLRPPSQGQPSLKAECGKIKSKTKSPTCLLGVSISTTYNLQMLTWQVQKLPLRWSTVPFVSCRH